MPPYVYARHGDSFCVQSSQKNLLIPSSPLTQHAAPTPKTMHPSTRSAKIFVYGQTLAKLERDEFSHAPDASSQARSCVFGWCEAPLLLCMGLFSQFWVPAQRCTASGARGRQCLAPRRSDST